jgi:D-alanyl-lipoteichoic acid acyltransferase DltB (MBOAT superfamily)
MANPFIVVRRRLAFEPRPARAADVRNLVGGLCGLAAGVAAGRQIFVVDWCKAPFLLEHSAKLIALYVPTLSGLAAGAAGWRLFGGSARDYMNRPYLARSPADFWRRYNRNFQQFFLEDVFHTLDGRLGRPARIMIVFSVSAMLHEYVFGIATGRVQGYQTAFFLLQGIAVAGTTRVRPRGWQAIPWATGTALFVLLSSTLFFASMHGVVPFYSRPFGGWSWEGWTRLETP